ncbi:lactonase family protein [Leifsonia sp. NPDC058248]|uniref:lactonase family protein n=1 Tax=Leifsonia sp. NPDC058248 TaxID=3346402 RepID=UPI0036D8D8EC
MTSELLIGTYTESLPHVDGRAEGILSARFDGERLIGVEVAARVTNPSWLTASADGSRVYSVIETAPDGGVTAFARDARGSLTPLGTASSGGAEPANLTLDPSGRFLVAGTYGGGSISVFALAADGSLGERTAFLQHVGHGPDPTRQEAPHVHQLSFDPVTGDLAVVDLGLGELRFYAFGDDGSIALRPDATVVAGAVGPRHLAFHPDGRHAFLVNELANTLDVLRRSADRFEIVATAATRSPDARGESAAAGVRVSAGGASVFVTNRGDDTVAVFAFDGEASALRPAGTVDARGRAPRDLVVSPDGTRILVANQDSGDVTVFAFDEGTRVLDFLSLTPVPTPVCVHFV